MTQWLVGKRFRRLYVALGLTVVVLVLTVGRPDPTEASWQDNEYAQGSFTAAVIQPIVVDSCVLEPGFLGLDPKVTLKWHFAAPTTYVLASNVKFYRAAFGSQSNLETADAVKTATSGPVAGVYTSTYGQGLLGGLLGSSIGLFLQVVDGGWTSVYNGALASAGLGGINPTCVHPRMPT